MKNLIKLGIVLFASFAFATPHYISPLEIKGDSTPPASRPISNSPAPTPKQAQDVENSRLPIGLYIFTFNAEDAQDLIKSLQESDYSKKKTDRILERVFQQSKSQEHNWSQQVREDSIKNSHK